MSAPAEALTLLPEAANKSIGDTGSDRRFDIDGKQLWVRNLLEELGVDGLLVLDPENFTWLTSGGCSRGILDPAQWPVLFFTAEHRCIIAGNVETQRLFDEEVDGLGFQLKEWPWYWGREKLLADLCYGRKVASDVPFGDCRPAGEHLKRQRRTLTPYEQACLRALGQVLGHALEATCRGVTPTQTEREVAGQLGHRLIHRGAHPVNLSIAAGGRSRAYRQCGYTSAVVGNFCVVTATARKYGLYATASRSVSFGPVDEHLRREAETVCKVCASYVGASWPDAVPKAILSAGRRVYQISDFEHEWRLCPQGHITGRSVVELPLLPQTEDLLQHGWAVTWQASAGAAFGCDTFLVTDRGPEVITPTEAWPQTRVRYHGADIILPFLLER